MPGSLLTPHDALSERSDASYRSTDSRASAKKVSFNRAVRVKQYPWTPDDSYSPEDGATHLSLPSRRFWFKVYKVKPQQVQNGDHGQDQNGSIYSGHYSQPQPTNSWEDDNGEDTYDSLAPIVEDDGTDHDDKNGWHRNGHLDDQHHFHRSYVKDIVSKFSGETAGRSRRENGASDSTKHVYPSDSSRQTTTKNPMLNGFKAVLAKSQAKLKGERKDISNRNTQQNDTRSERYSYQAISPPKQSSAGNYTRNMNSEKFTEVNDKSTVPIKIPRAESPQRGRGNNERFSMRYKTHQRRSRSTDDTNHREANATEFVSTDKSVSTDDLDSSGMSWISRINKDKSTQCNGTLLRCKPLTAYGTPRLPRSSLSNLVKREEPGDKRNHVAPQNGNFKVKPDTAVNNSRSYTLNNRSAGDNNHKSGSHFESSERNTTSETPRNVSHIITKPRIAMNSYRTQNNKNGGAATKPTNSHPSNQHGGFGEVKSAELYERGRGLSIVPEERSASKQNWSNTPLVERRASSWERSHRPTAATVGYQRGRYVASQRLRGDGGVVNGFEATRNGNAALPPKPRERDRFVISTRDAGQPSLQPSETAQNGREISGPLKNGSVPATGDTQAIIDWSLSGFQLGPPIVDRGLVSDSECFVHQRQPLLMYIPGVSHHKKPALEEDRMSGISGISRGDMDDDLKLPSNATSSYVFNRRNSMPKDCNKSWVKWKIGGKPSRQP